MLFYLLAVIAVIAGLVMVTRRHPLSAALSLVVCFIAMAGIYALLTATFMAIIQILVYAGAIMALIVFVIMLLNVREEHLDPGERIYLRVGLALAATAPVLLLLVKSIQATPMPQMAALPAQFGEVGPLGMHLFTEFLFPFEVVSILLLVALVGVIVLAKRKVAT